MQKIVSGSGVEHAIDPITLHLVEYDNFERYPQADTLCGRIINGVAYGETQPAGITCEGCRARLRRDGYEV